MNVLRYLVFLGVAVQFVGIFTYIRETFRGKTKPNRVTWLMWSIAPLIATFAAISDGVSLAVLPVFMSGFGPLLVFIASFISRKSYWKLVKFDYFYGLLSLLALILWAITKNPNIAIVFAIASDGLAAVPTLVKGWKRPETESVGPFTAGLFSALTSFPAIKTWTFSSYGFAIYLVLINLSLIFVVWRKKIFTPR